MSTASPKTHSAVSVPEQVPSWATRGLTRTRWPAAVYNQGQDPDPRFTFSNERTLLAWIRTGLALSAAGIAVGTFVQEFSRPLRLGIAAALLLAASVSSLGGFIHWMQCERALRHKRPLPSPKLAAALALAISLLGVAGLYGILAQ